jgi:hypothetical protein
MTDSAHLEEVRRDYLTAFLRYLPRQEEATLALGYEIGRAAVADGVSVLEIVEIHHGILRGVVQDTPPAEVDDVLERAAEFLAEVLATVDMTQRALISEDSTAKPSEAPRQDSHAESA